ncbi:MAG: hypothetical protein ABEH78_02660 [Haloferacaceae archaeon]
MGDTSDERVGDEAAGASAPSADRSGSGSASDGRVGDDEHDPEDLEALRRRVESEYDFDDFGPGDMAQMSAEEWEAAFDPDSWIVGEELLDRVRRDLEARIARREVFAALDRVVEDGEPRIAAWSDEGYALVHPDGTVEGSGTVLRDVKASVALCSMESYEVEEPPAEFELPAPEDVPEGTGEFGNLMIQIVAAVQLLAGLGLTGAWLTGAVTTIVAPVAALCFLLVGVFLFGVVANARLSDKFRAEEFRDRLRAVEGADAERPEFLPPSAAPTDGRDGSAGSGEDAPPAANDGERAPADSGDSGPVQR